MLPPVETMESPKTVHRLAIFREYDRLRWPAVNGNTFSLSEGRRGTCLLRRCLGLDFASGD